MCPDHVTDLAKETNREIEMSEDDETHEKNENGDDGPSNFLYELNLIVTVLSLFSLPSEDCTDGPKEDGKSVKDNEAKAAESRLCSRKRERDIHDQKSLVRRTQRFQPMIKDSRHGRKM